MSRLAPTDWRTLVRVFEADGFTRDRTTGSSCSASRASPGPVVIPKYADVGLDIIGNNVRTAGMSRERYFELLGEI